MSKKILIILTLVMALLVGVSLVSAQGPSKLPGSGWWSGQQIQNVGEGPASITFTTYDMNGTGVPCGNPKSADKGASVNFLTVDCNNITTPFVGSAVVSSNEPIVAQVNVVNMSLTGGPGGRAAGMYRGTDGSDVSKEIAFPLMKHNFFKRSTALYIQNASTEDNNITVTVKIGNTPHVKQFTGVKPYAMVVVGPTDTNPPMPTNQYGSATVTGTQPLAGTALEFEEGVALGNNLHAYTAFTPQDYAPKAYCPLIRSNFVNLNTGIQAQNVSQNPQQIKITYSYRIKGQGTLETESVTKGPINPGAAAVFSTWLELPKDAVGSAVVEGLGNGNIAVTVNDETFTLNPNRVTAYSCFPDTASQKTTEVAIPLYKEFYLGDTSGIQIQNIGTGNANVTVTYFPTGYYPTNLTSSGPVVFKNTSPIPPNASLNLYRVSNPLPVIQVDSGNPSTLLNSYGSVLVESNQPIVAIVNEEPGATGGAARPASNQDAKQYEGFNQ